ncbi:helix-turn-helix domain-containing protein [Actinomadura sp. NAK00032]|uniref:helix-turn-helix domain-containing protein n=1 Tax=Actinomadura sp. NAK00032 TaxID=2742128 RepID=UPI0034A492CD
MAGPERGLRPGVRLYTPGEAAVMLQVRESWLRKKASARAIPCTFIGKHLRFSDQDVAAIIAAGSKAAGRQQAAGPSVGPAELLGTRRRRNPWRTRRSAARPGGCGTSGPMGHEPPRAGSRPNRPR